MIVFTELISFVSILKFDLFHELTDDFRVFQLIFNNFLLWTEKKKIIRQTNLLNHRGKPMVN